MQRISIIKIVMIFFILVITVSPLAAEKQLNIDPIKNNDLTNSMQFSNQGFIKNPSAELKNKFSMCDEFLNIEWIDKEKGIGYSLHDLYKDGKAAGHMKSFVYFQSHSAMDRIELYDFDRKGELDKLFDAIRNGQIITNHSSPWPLVKYKEFRAILHSNNTYEFTYADNRKNVCIPYPNGDRMWLVEGRQVGKILSRREIDLYLSNIKKIYPDYTHGNFVKQFVSDINEDGVDDYYGSEVFTVSNKDKFEFIEKLDSNLEGVNRVFNFGVKDMLVACKVYDYEYQFITTDGKSYFLNNQCNLTKLSTF